MSNAVQHGMPGEWARANGTVFSLWPLFVCLVLMGAFGAALVLGSHMALFACLFVASFVFAAVMWRRGLRNVESYFKGARGEERVAGILAGLPGEYHVFHDFVAGRYHVDHVVAGPAGVFCVETKNWSGAVTVEENRVLVDGHLPTRQPADQAAREADALARRLSAAGWTGTITPVVCFASDAFVDGLGRVGSVCLVNASRVVPWVLERPQSIPQDELGRLVKLMANADWPARPAGGESRTIKDKR